MHQLIVVSTQMEIQPLMKKAGLSLDFPQIEAVELRDDLSLMISGIGIPPTVYYLTRILGKDSFDRVIQVGVAGSYNPALEVGSLVEVGVDCFADLGIDDNGKFVNVFDAGLADYEMEPFSKGLLINPNQGLTGLPLVYGITLNTVTGSSGRMEQWKNIYHPDVESLEGAAALYVCLMNNIPIVQVRSISNRVEPRKRDAWELDLAVDNLNKWLMNFISLENPQ